MEKQNNISGMLELMLRPAFCVQDGKIICANCQAKELGIPVGAPVSDILSTGAEEYAAHNCSSLYLTVQTQRCRLGASVTQLDDLDVFTLEPETILPELQALALASRELREPLSTLMVAADRLLPTLDQTDSTVQKHAAGINRGLHHMLRLLDNMSDSARYAEDPMPRQEYSNVTALMGEFFDKAAALVEDAGITLVFTNHTEEVRSMVDVEKLRRAVFNLISNAVKFTPKGGCIEAKLTRHENTVHLTVTDNGRGIPKDQFSNLYSRYLRPCTIEDSRHGIGLGMFIVQAAATAHGGTVLIEQPQEGGTKVTFTMAIRHPSDGNFRSPHRVIIDYSGGRDRGLVELADLLPSSSFQINKIN